MGGKRTVVMEANLVLLNQVIFCVDDSINDGVSWKLQDEGNTLGNAIFGPLADSSLSDSIDASLDQME